MTLSYLINPFSGDGKRRKVKTKITTNHSASSYGQPVIVLSNGDAIDLFSWVACGYTVLKTTDKERKQLRKLGLCL